MGCASSTLFSPDEDFSPVGGSTAFTHHFVSLTSTTYGLLTLDPHSPTITVPPSPTPPPPPRITLGSLFPSPLSQPRSLSYQPPESFSSWDLIPTLDADHIPTFRLPPPSSLQSKPSDPPIDKQAVTPQGNEENFSPNFVVNHCSSEVNALTKDLLDGFELISPPNGEDKLVVYTTTLRGVRRTFDECNAVRSAIEGLGVSIHERDVSMDRGFRDELRELMKERENNELIPPRVFVKGRYIGGFEVVMKMVEDGVLEELLQGLPRVRERHVCEGCGGVRFLPCFTCNGSCKMAVKEDIEVEGKMMVVRCSDCNENGLVRCPVCS